MYINTLWVRATRHTSVEGISEFDTVGDHRSTEALGLIRRCRISPNVLYVHITKIDIDYHC